MEKLRTSGNHEYTRILKPVLFVFIRVHSWFHKIVAFRAGGKDGALVPTAHTTARNKVRGFLWTAGSGYGVMSALGGAAPFSG